MPIVALAMFLWVALWLCVAAKYTAAKEGDALVEAFARLLPPFVVVTNLVAFAALPTRNPAVSVVILWLHHTSFFLLFAFLLTGQYFQIEAWWKIHEHMPRQSIGASYRRFWVLTKVVPAPVALMIFLTGLRLLWQAHGNTMQRPGNTMSAFWLQGLVVGFSVFFWDGIFEYTPIVHGLRTRWELVPGTSGTLPQPESFIETLQLLIHVLSWPLVFLLGVFRWSFPTILTHPIDGLEGHLTFLSKGWPDVVVAILLWLTIGLIVSFFRFCFRFAGCSPVILG